MDRGLCSRCKHHADLQMIAQLDLGGERRICLCEPCNSEWERVWEETAKKYLNRDIAPKILKSIRDEYYLVSFVGAGITNTARSLHGAVEDADLIDDPVNHPSHYTFSSKFEVIEVIEEFKLNFHLGNTVKYIARAGKKGDALEDLKKAAWYLNREIERRELEKKNAK